MAELVLQIQENHPTYEEGDILCAFSDRRIGVVHASHICHPRQHGFTSDGLRARDTLLEVYQLKGYQYKFVRVSQTEVQRINLATLGMDILGPTPNKAGEYIDVRLFLERRLKHPSHTVFGIPGAEIWYGGRWNPDVDNIWSEIEARTNKRRDDHRKWPLTDHERRVFLPIGTSDMPEQEASDLVEAIFDVDASGEIRRDANGAPLILKARANQIPRTLLMSRIGGRLSLTQLRDKSLVKDLRDVMLDRAAMVRAKPRGGR